MKLLFIAIFVLLNSFKLYAQVVHIVYSKDFSKFSTVDSTKIRIWYAFNAEDIKKSETFEDLHCLEIGSQMSKFYSDFVYTSDSLMMIQRKKNQQSGARRGHHNGKQGQNYWSEYYFTDYFKEFSKGALTAYTQMPRWVSFYQYTENIPIQDWTLLDDTETIAGYLCQKAICTFRGRDYIAWFAPDIPINNGPWKFGGLPGLILKVYDTEKIYVWESVKISFYQRPVAVTKWDVNGYTKISWNNYRTVVENIYNGKATPLGTSAPYNPLELE